MQDDKIDPVDLNYICVQIREIGKEHNNSPILLLHGLTSSYFSWDGVQQMLALRTGRRVCAVDLRNHGDSPWKNRTDIEAMAVDIGHFLDNQNIQKVNLIGHSLGGKVSVHYTLKNPERVESLVVEDMRTNSITPTATVFVQMAAKYLPDAIKAVPEGSTVDEASKIVAKALCQKHVKLCYNETVNDDKVKKLPIRCQNGLCEWKMNVERLLQVVDDPNSVWTESKGLYRGPTLFLYGTNSFFDVPGDERNILELFPNAKLVAVEGAGHMIHEKYREFEDEVIKFLNV